MALKMSLSGLLSLLPMLVMRRTRQCYGSRGTYPVLEIMLAASSATLPILADISSNAPLHVATRPSSLLLILQNILTLWGVLQ